MHPHPLHTRQFFTDLAILLSLSHALNSPTPHTPPTSTTGTGILIKPSIKDAGGNVTLGADFTHYVVVTGVYADAPARQKLVKSMGHAAYLGCMFCCLTGELMHGTMRFLGYADPAPISRGLGVHRFASAGSGVPVAQMVVDADRLHIHDGLQWLRAMGVEHPAAGAAPPDPAFIGVCGVSVFFDLLWYSSFTQLFLVPLCHAFHHGVLKNFLTAIVGKEGGKKGEGGGQEVDIVDGFVDEGRDDERVLAPRALRPEHRLSRHERAELRARSEVMVLTQDFGRRVCCIDPSVKALTMEEGMRAIDCVLPVLFAEVGAAGGCLGLGSELASSMPPCSRRLFLVANALASILLPVSHRASNAISLDGA